MKCRTILNQLTKMKEYLHRCQPRVEQAVSLYHMNSITHVNLERSNTGNRNQKDYKQTRTIIYICSISNWNILIGSCQWQTAEIVTLQRCFDLMIWYSLPFHKHRPYLVIKAMFKSHKTIAWDVSYTQTSFQNIHVRIGSHVFIKIR